jgi:hypothetical protein
MCTTGQPPAPPLTAAQAVEMVKAGLGWLATADATTLTCSEQAECLRGLGQAQSMHTAAQSRVLSAFDAGGGHQADGHPTARSWLRWQTGLTHGAAAGAVGWMRRLAAHPGVAAALAGGKISESWAREICKWSDLLPEAVRADADTILLVAAAAGADLDSLAALAEEIRKHTATPDEDDDGGFGDRYLKVSRTFGGAGVIDGELTPECTEALRTVLDALGKKRGPEDTRSKRQRDHDAMEEAMRLLIGAKCLPDRGGQPTQIQLHMTLDQLRGMPDADAAEAAWAGTPAGPGADCDATVIPVVTGHVGQDVLDQLAAGLLHGSDSQTRKDLTERAVRQIIVRRAADLLSGPTGLAAFLRNGVSDRLAASVSLPLDVGAAVEIIPAHLRRAVIARDRHCRFPGCDQPAAACQPHHIIPRSEGGPTSLTNMLLLCTFHHLIAIHRWGWGIVLLPDGTVTATSPDRRQVLHSHGPPTRAA